MSSVLKTASAIVAAFSLAFVSAIPASAGTSEVWKTTSKSDWVGIADVGQKVAVNGNVSAVAWVERTSIDTAYVDAKIRRNGTWGKSTRVFDVPWNWWAAFDVQITDSGTVYLSYSDSDVNMKVATSTSGSTWTTTIVDSNTSNLGAMQSAGSVSGNKITFTANRYLKSESSNQSVTVEASTYSFDEANVGSGWDHKIVRTFTRANFSSCVVNKKAFYDSCNVRVSEPLLKTATDGSQVIFYVTSRESSRGDQAGLQFKVSKFHRPSLTADWISGGDVYTMTLNNKDNAYAFFPVGLATTSTGKYAFAIITGKLSDGKNMTRVFTGDSFASVPAARDTAYLSSLKNHDNAALGEFNGDFYMVVDDRTAHRFGKVGSFAATAKNLTAVTGDEVVKNLLVVGGKITAVVVKPRVSTSLMTLTKNSWSGKTKVMSVAGDFSPTPSAAATDGTSLLLAAPTYTTKFAKKVLTAYTN
jgi:hypothetical protein